MPPNTEITDVVDFDMNHVGMATDRTIFDILLAGSGCRIDGHDDLFAAALTDIAAVVLHVVELALLRPIVGRAFLRCRAIRIHAAPTPILRRRIGRFLCSEAV